MGREFFRRKRITVVMIVLSLALLSLVIQGCGGRSGYDTPSTTQTSSALISADTLKGWIDSGKVNGSGYDRVVVLDVNSPANYAYGHIPGAQFLNSNDIYQTRTEGPATDINMVLDGSHMDALIQKYGIDRNTTIVFTSGSPAKNISGGLISSPYGDILNATRLYWTFRYWGFPKERLKVLDGINIDYAAKYGPLTTAAAPQITPSTYSVRNNGILRSDLRASLSDMINVAEGKVPNELTIDMRSSTTSGSYAGAPGSTPGVFPPAGDFVVFEGHIKGATALSWQTLLDPNNNYRFLPASQLIAQFTAIGLDSTKTAYVY